MYLGSQFAAPIGCLFLSAIIYCVGQIDEEYAEAIWVRHAYIAIMLLLPMEILFICIAHWIVPITFFVVSGTCLGYGFKVHQFRVVSDTRKTALV